MNEQARWRKSSFSGAQSDCVEASHRRDAIRDSKNHTVTLRGDFCRLLDAVKANCLTR